MSAARPEPPDRMATDLLRLARHPLTGRVRGGGTIDIALRAALLSDLVLDGRITHDGRGPRLTGEDAAEPTGDRIADALVRTVARRSGVPWWRWYRHVQVDRVALTEELVEAGVWTRTGSGPRATYEDVEPEYGPALGIELREVVTQEDTSDVRRALLAIIVHLSGADGQRAQPKALRRDLKGYAQKLRAESYIGKVTTTAVAGGTVLMRRRFRR